jgi:hypothetical protein
MRAQGIGDDVITRIVWDNPLAFFSQSERFDLADADAQPVIDRSQKFETNSVLRGEPARAQQ